MPDVRLHVYFDLVPPLSRFRSERCEAEVSAMTAYWRDRALKDHRCELGAAYQVQGKKFCKRHAGDALLKLALTEYHEKKRG